jgi:hypothetical protein
VAVDGLNKAFIPTEYKDIESRPILGTQLSALHTVIMRFFGKSSPLKRGAVLGAAKEPAVWKGSTGFEMLQKRLTADNVQHESFNIPKMSLAELQEILKYYARAGLLRRGK